MSLASKLTAGVPAWMRRALISMSERDGRLVTWLKVRAASGIPVPEPASAAGIASQRLLVSPFNYSGQAWQWARTVRGNDTEAVNLAMQAPGDRGFLTDFSVPATIFLGSAEWKSRQAAALGGFTHLLIESFTSPLGNGRGDAFRLELQGWHAAGKRIAFLCHGSDIRSPRTHRERSSFSPFTARESDARRLQKRVDAAHRLITDTGYPVFVSTPDLLHDVPEATWLPLVIDAERWRTAGERRELLSDNGTVPVVTHAPTSPVLKGSAFVARAAEQLSAQIEYRPLSGVAAADMPAAIAAADIVVDQLLIGSYGVAACEAMAAGRVVIGNVDAEIRAQVQNISGIELPIIQADPHTIETVLRELAANPEVLRAHAEAGPQFVGAVHTGARTKEVLRDFLRS